MGGWMDGWMDGCIIIMSLTSAGPTINTRVTCESCDTIRYLLLRYSDNMNLTDLTQTGPA